MDAAQALATMAEREPPQPWPWVGMQAPAHYTEWGMQYGRAHGPAGTARWIDPLPPRTHPAIRLIGKVEDVLADCVDVGRSAMRAGARADRSDGLPD
ncbi:hypothetical protein H1235_07425 [Pseudoxanthomonas sp. NC8]|nr:hypothetical protein H1235_07425 [Pseudoxanthomonas sp. NC8]